MAAFGFALQAEEGGEFEVWPDNWPPFNLFKACNTQWQVGAAGAVGLRYEVLPFMFKTYGIKKKDRADMLTDIKTCERAALDLWAEQRGQ